MKNVSVVCPVHNTDPTMLLAAARSVLRQEGAAVAELILVDDVSSSPATQEALTQLATEDPRVRLLRNPRTFGPAGTRNMGVRAATSEWIGFLDADDLWPPNSLATRLAAPAGEDDCVLGAFEELLVGDVKRPAVPLPLETGQDLGNGWVAWEAPHSAYGVIALWRHLGGLLAPKKALEKVGLFDEQLRYGEDWLLLVRLTLVCRVIASNKPVYILRRQHESLMTSSARLTRVFSKAEEKAYSDPALRAYRKHLRWALLRQYKGMAVNNLANGRHLMGVQFALRAWLLDPREIQPLLRFLRAASIRDPARGLSAARRYTTAVVTPNLK